jgi:hypothetical protein
MIFLKQIKHIFFLSLLIALTACAVEDETSPAPSDVYVKFFGSTGSQRLEDMLINPDQNVVMVGQQTLAELGADANIYIVEADTNGNEIRSAVISLDEYIHIDSANHSTEESNASIINTNDGYIIAGNFGELVDAQILATNMYWMHLNRNLEVLKWDTIQTPGYELLAADLVQTQDNNVVLLGSTTFQAVNDLTPNADFQYFLIKRDFVADTTIFRKTYGFSNSNEIASNLFELTNGDLTIIGQTDRQGSAGGEGGTNISIMILNSLATAQKSSKEYGLSINGTNTSDDTPFDAIYNSSGFVVVGTSTLGNSQQAFVMGISNSGALIFRNTLDSQWGINSTGSSVVQTRENDLFVVGSYPIFSVSDETIDPNFRNKNGEMMVIRTNPFGYPKTGVESNFGLVSGDDEANKVVRLPSGSLIVGATIDFGSGQRMFALHKMNDRAILQRP